MVTLAGVVFVAAATSRSQAYAQAMAAKGWAPELTIRYRPSDQAAERPPAPELGAALFTPDLGVPLDETIAAWAVERLPSETINDPALCAAVAAAKPRLVVFSGTGGELVGPGILGLGAPVLHIHSGWLPDDRGSTTVYHSLLRRGDCGVTALFLDVGIDTGAIVARRRYPAPTAGTDIDHLYDGAIRADLLVHVLGQFLQNWGCSARRAPAGAGHGLLPHPSGAQARGHSLA